MARVKEREAPEKTKEPPRRTKRLTQTEPALSVWRLGTQRWVLRVLIIVQLVAALFFASEIIASIFQLPAPNIDWEVREILELIAILAIVLGAFFGHRLIVLANQQTKLAEDALKSVKRALAQSIEEQFDEWEFSASETGVAWLLVKGFSYSEIASLRGTTEATVKSHANAIYQKSGFKGRSQLTAWFLEDIFDSND